MFSNISRVRNDGDTRTASEHGKDTATQWGHNLDTVRTHGIYHPRRARPAKLSKILFKLLEALANSLKVFSDLQEVWPKSLKAFLKLLGSLTQKFKSFWNFGKFGQKFKSSFETFGKFGRRFESVCETFRKFGQTFKSTPGHLGSTKFWFSYWL